MTAPAFRTHDSESLPAIGRAWRLAVIPLLFACWFVALTPAQGFAGDGATTVEGQVIREIRIVGNQTVSTLTIQAEIKSREGRPLKADLVDADLQRLLVLKLFSDVRTSVARVGESGVVLTFTVIEMPLLKKVEFIGLKAVKLKDVQESTGLKAGKPADSTKAKMAVNQIRQLYVDKGYDRAEVKLIKGGKIEDREVIYSIFEGPRSQVGEIDFIGNSFVDDAMLRTKISSRKPIFNLMITGHYEKDGFDDDARKLSEYYQSNGYLGVTVRPVVRAGSDLGTKNVTFVIDEGKRFKVRNLIFEGNKVFATDFLKKGLKLHSGEYFNDAIQAADRLAISGKYTGRGHIDAEVQVEPKITTEDDVVDLVYRISEGDEYFLADLIIAGNSRTQERVVRREADMAGLLPGERLDSTRIDKFKTRLGNTGLFQMNPQLGKPIDAKIINRRRIDQPYTDAIPSHNDVSLTRLQNPEDDGDLPGTPPPLEVPPRLDQPLPTATPGGGDPGMAPFGQGGSAGVFAPDVNTIPTPIEIPTRTNPLDPAPGRGGRPAGLPKRQNGPANGIPSPSSSNINGQTSDRQEPFSDGNAKNTAERAYADIITNVDEAATARFQVGVGASSFGGLYGSISLTENNFNLLAFPRSLDDFRQGRAFRGAGQQFSLELSPGTLINQYIVSFRDPMVFDLPIAYGMSGYQFSRYYQDWHEQRSGGRFSLGKQFGTQAYGEVAFRIEDVDLTGFKYPAPALLLDASGHSTLATIRPSFRVDTRDNPFLPNTGTFAEAAYEQGFGTYTFGKATAEARKYMTVGSRPDGSGKRVVTVRGYFGVSSRDTPIYERFYAGNLNSLRGFAYRGIGPYVLGVNTGGIMTALTSVEYRFPWTASDNFQQVLFVDTGTVENDYQFTNYRVSVGTGFRILIPQVFKQIPLAFDLAFPLHKGPQDRVQAFNFSVGASW